MIKRFLLSAFLAVCAFSAIAQVGMSSVATPTGAYNYTKINSNVTTVVKGSYGTLRSININTSGTASIATVYDSKVIPPVQAAATTSSTGGTLAAATYYYVVTTVSAAGESFRSNEVSVATAGTTSSNTINWSAVSGATGYKIYRGTAAGVEDVFYSVGIVTTFLDTGAANTAGTPPSGNPIAVINSASAPGTLLYDVAFSNGLVIVTTGTTAGDITISYK